MGKGGKGKGKGPVNPPPPRAGTAQAKARPDWRARRQQEEEAKQKIVGVDICSLPAGPLNDPRWKTTFAAAASSEGSDGVVFIATKAGAFAVKASSKPAEEYFATKVLRHLGVRSPDIRIVCHVDSEWRDVKQAVATGARRAMERRDDATAHRLKLRLAGPLNRAQLSIMGLVPHASPLLSNTQAQAFFEDTADSVAVELDMIGRCLAVDVLLNNSDRFMAPCWDNEGNGGNLLLASCGAGASRLNLQVFAIDSAGTCLATNSDYFMKYSRRARNFLESVLDMKSAVDSLRPLKEFIQSNCSVVLNDDALLEVRKGVLQVVSNVSAGCSEGPGTLPGSASFIEWLEVLHNAVQKKVVRTDWQNVWRDSANLIDMEFLRQMVSMFQEVAQLHQESLPQPSFGPIEPPLGITDSAPCANTAGMPDELWKALPVEIQDEMLNVQDEPFKILVMQMATKTAFAAAGAVDKALKADREQTGRMAGLVILPENVFREKLLSDITPLLADEEGRAPAGGASVPSELKHLADVAKEHSIYIVCGSMYEPEEEGKPRYYITSVVVGPDGRAVGAYRKRKIHNHQVQLMGDRPLTFHVPGLGKAAVLICLDAEDQGLRDEVLNLGVSCVLNPIHIPEPPGDDAEAWRATWQSAVTQMADNFTHICHTRGITWVRCDRPCPDGLGSSQVIGPEFTYRTGSMYEEALSTCLLPPPSSGNHLPLLVEVPASSYERQGAKQNCGPRCTISSAFVDGKVTRMQFYNSGEPTQAAKSKSLHVTLSDQSAATVQVSPMLCVKKFGKVGTPDLDDILNDARRAGVAEASDLASSKHRESRWLDNNRRFMLSLNDVGALTVHKMGSDGNLRRPLVIPTSERFQGLAVDQQSGIFATASWVDESKSRISIWSFSHNCIPAPLCAFLDL
mmetsp:Transcript_63180/g.120454  ORF Transcript_63180/g.120454 Transcript_63180/m.120454 type:complete len:908 (-) Transcript_63180:34-2757(-)